jgi:transcription antitermination factor NusG
MSSPLATIKPPLPALPFPVQWFAVQTLARHEKRVEAQLLKKRISTYLPVLQKVQQWSDRRKEVQLPLFGCYLFVRIPPLCEERLQVLKTFGVLSFVGSEGQGTAIPDEEIESIRAILREKVPYGLHPFVRTGMKVRIRGGSLDGVEGILVGRNRDQSVVVSVQLLQRSLAIRVEGYQIELI